MEDQRAKTINDLIDDCSHHFSNFTKWPESEATKEALEKTIKAFCKAFHADSYPNVFLYFSILHIASSVYAEGVNRKTKFKNYKDTWIRMADLFDAHNAR